MIAMWVCMVFGAVSISFWALQVSAYPESSCFIALEAGSDRRFSEFPFELFQADSGPGIVGSDRTPAGLNRISSSHQAAIARPPQRTCFSRSAAATRRAPASDLSSPF